MGYQINRNKNNNTPIQKASSNIQKSFRTKTRMSQFADWMRKPDN